MSDDIERFNAKYAGSYLGDEWVVRASDYEALAKKLELYQALGLPEPGKELIHGLNDEGHRLLGSKEAVQHFQGQHDSLRQQLEQIQKGSKQ